MPLTPIALRAVAQGPWPWPPDRPPGRGPRALALSPRQSARRPWAQVRGRSFLMNSLRHDGLNHFAGTVVLNILMLR